MLVGVQAPLAEKLSGVGLAVPWVLSNLVSPSIYGLISEVIFG